MIDESNYLTDLAPWSKDTAVKLGIIEGLDIEKDHIEILIKILSSLELTT